MPTELDELLKEAERLVNEADTQERLEAVRVALLGKKGKLTRLLKSLSSLSKEARKTQGQALNHAKQTIQQTIQAKLRAFHNATLNQALEKEALDITLPGRAQTLGAIHPVTRVRERVEALFTSMGFDVVSERESPEIEDEYHNFTALNIPQHHPARAMHDTFYFPNGLLLRTHTSPTQIRTMLNRKPPLRVITPGRVYRCDSDQTHTPMFHQLEGFLVDEHTSFADLKGILMEFLDCFFERSLKFRFRASYFPFTEPSAELDMSCTQCEGAGCRACKETGWLEILGCGMVHPVVLENVGIDSERYTGFAFGIGLDRLAMLRYRIDDLRLMFGNDLSFLQQFC